MEYVGEVLDYRAFKYRTRQYARENHEHHYFMALSADEVIDAAKKGNVSRFINHCCDPNAETQKVIPVLSKWWSSKVNPILIIINIVIITKARFPLPELTVSITCQLGPC